MTDSPIARVAEALANHFTSAEIKHFPFADYDAALAWLKPPEAGRVRARLSDTS